MPVVSQVDRAMSNAKQPCRRKLGGIEAMYNFYLSRGTDVLTMMARLESVYPVYEPAVRWALNTLMARHPMLRVSIEYDKSSEEKTAVFVENDLLELDFLALDRADWLDLILEEVHKPFDDRKALWRCRMLNAPSVKVGYTHSKEALSSLKTQATNNVTNAIVPEVNKYIHKSVLVFISHHSIMDGGYIVWIFQELVNLLDAFVLNTSIGPPRALPFLASIEDCITCPQLSEAGTMGLSTNHSNCQMTFCYDSVDPTAIDAYNKRFGDEILTLSQHPPRNELLYFKCSKEDTSAFMRVCARENCKLSGALAAATILAIVDLIYPDTGDSTSFEIPFEFIVDLRRHYRIENLGSDELVPYYTGVATSHISLSVKLELGKRPVVGSEFWTIAKCLEASLQNLTVNPNAVIINKMKQEYDSFTKDPDIQRQTGKSPFLLCLSNLGRLDNAIDENLRDRIRLTDVHGHSSTLVDHMPVFFVTFITVGGHLTGSISYCKSYTSAQTTMAYMRYLQHYIDQTTISSKL